MVGPRIGVRVGRLGHGGDHPGFLGWRLSGASYADLILSPCDCDDGHNSHMAGLSQFPRCHGAMDMLQRWLASGCIGGLAWLEGLSHGKELVRGGCGGCDKGW